MKNIVSTKILALTAAALFLASSVPFSYAAGGPYVVRYPAQQVNEPTPTTNAKTGQIDNAHAVRYPASMSTVESSNFVRYPPLDSNTENNGFTRYPPVASTEDNNRFVIYPPPKRRIQLAGNAKSGTLNINNQLAGTTP